MIDSLIDSGRPQSIKHEKIALSSPLHMKDVYFRGFLLGHATERKLE